MVSLSDFLNADPSYQYEITDLASNLKEEYVKEEVSLLDKDWFDVRFIPPSSKMNAIVAKNRFYSTASKKFTSTRLGGSLPINPKPQSSPLSDMPVPNRIYGEPYRLQGSEEGGMGRVYSEVHDDWQHLLYLNFGKPEFTSLTDFFLSAVDYRDSYIANTGRLPTGYNFGKLVGAGVMLAAFPLMTLTIWGLKFASKLALGSSSFDFYHLSPTMHMYWSGVNQMVTVLATEMGLMSPELMADATKADRIGVPSRFDTEDLEQMHEFMPDLISEDGFIDVYKIVAQPQILNNRALTKEKELYDRGEISEYDFLGYIVKDGTVKEANSPGSEAIDTRNYNLSFNNFLNKLTKGEGLYAEDLKDDTGTLAESTESSTGYTKDDDGLYPTNASPEKLSYMEKLTEAIDSGIKDGGMYAVFAVDPIGSVSESFNNSFSSIDLGDKINSVAGTARNAKFNLAGGNIVGETVKDALSAGKNMAAGALDSITMGLGSVVQTLTGNGYVNIAQKWENSSISMPEISYSISLRRTYNTPFSILKDELIPFCMLLNAIAPLAAGRASKASPYLCEAFCKGHQHIKLGMFKSMTVNRAVGNMPYDLNKKTIGMDITFSIADLNPEITMPVNASIFDSFAVALEDDTPLNRYLSVIASRDLLTSKYMVPKAKLRASRLLMNLDQALSPHATGLAIGGALNGILGGLVADHALALTESNKN